MSEHRKVRWGVLGAARIARSSVIPAIDKSANGEVRALASRSQKRAKKVAREHDIAVAYEGYDKLLADPEIEAVYIPLPNHMHREWTLRAIEAGKHVLCEKPLAMNATEAREMVEAAQGAGMLLMEAFMYRFHPRSLRIKERVAKGAIGDVRLIRAAFCFSRRADPTDYRFKPEMGGGSLMDVGCYGVSVARWMMDAEPEEVYASAVYGPSGVDLITVGLLRFPGERIAVVESSFATTFQQTYTIVGTRGAIEMPHDAFVPGEENAVFMLRGVRDKEGKVETTPGADEYQLMVEHFASAVLGEKGLMFPPGGSIANMRVLDALAESAREGHPVAIPS